MQPVKWIFTLFSKFVSLPQPQEEDIETGHLPEFDSTAFAQSRDLPGLNRLRKEELLGQSFTDTLPSDHDDFGLREQFFMERAQKRVSKMSDRELLDFVTSRESDFYGRRVGAAELVNRKVAAAYVLFLYSVIDRDSEDPIIRIISTIGLGELGDKGCLKALKNVGEDDTAIYDYAQKAIDKIQGHEANVNEPFVKCTAVKVLKP